jgi:hypothetical protein
VDEVVAGRGQLVFLHALNPFGFANRRRVNEDNADLNRNFLLPPNELYHGDSPAYAKLNSFLNPEGAPRRFDFYLPKVLWKIARVGLSTLKQVVAEGQFAFPKGIFFGGHEAALSTKIVHENMMRWVRGQHVVHLDFHTGLGEHAKYKLLVTSPLSNEELALYKELYGSEVEIASGEGIAYKTRGDFGRYMAATASQANYHFLFVEFGTYSAIRVLGALRRENQAHFYAPEGSDVREQAKAKLLECFFPSCSSWRSQALERGQAIIQRAQRAAPILASR